MFNRRNVRTYDDPETDSDLMTRHLDAFLRRSCNTSLDYATCDTSYNAYMDTHKDQEFSLTLHHIYAAEIAAKCEDMGMRITGYIAQSDPYTTGDFCDICIFMKDDDGKEWISSMSLLPSGDMRCACPGTIRSEGIFLSSHYIDEVAIRAAALVSIGHKLPWDYTR